MAYFCIESKTNAMQTPDEVLLYIKRQIGLDLVLCDYFTGIRHYNGQKYFNAVLSQRTSESDQFARLSSFADRSGLISVQPNGVNRVAVFF